MPGLGVRASLGILKYLSRKWVFILCQFQIWLIYMYMPCQIPNRFFLPYLIPTPHCYQTAPIFFPFTMNFLLTIKFLKCRFKITVHNACMKRYDRRQQFLEFHLTSFHKGSKEMQAKDTCNVSPNHINFIGYPIVIEASFKILWVHKHLNITG